MKYILAMPFLAPILYLQGKRVRKSALQLPEASGDREGTVGSGGVIRLLILGDSSAAGVGVSKQSEALTGNLVERLSKHARVEWKLIAKTGLTTADTIQHLQQEPRTHFDHIVVCLGVNDVTSSIGVRHWIQAQRELRSLLRNRFQAKHLIVNGLPPMRLFPLLPQPLRWYLGCKALHFSKQLKSDLQQESDCTYLALEFTPDVKLMAADGFHPGPKIYKEWSDRLAGIIMHQEKL